MSLKIHFKLTAISPWDQWVNKITTPYWERAAIDFTDYLDMNNLSITFDRKWHKQPLSLCCFRTNTAWRNDYVELVACDPGIRIVNTNSRETCSVSATCCENEMSLLQWFTVLQWKSNNFWTIRDFFINVLFFNHKSVNFFLFFVWVRLITDCGRCRFPLSLDFLTNEKFKITKDFNNSISVIAQSFTDISNVNTVSDIEKDFSKPKTLLLIEFIF